MTANAANHIAIRGEGSGMSFLVAIEILQVAWLNECAVLWRSSHRPAAGAGFPHTGKRHIGIDEPRGNGLNSSLLFIYDIATRTVPGKSA